jgi:hypothetical protein
MHILAEPREFLVHGYAPARIGTFRHRLQACRIDGQTRKPRRQVVVQFAGELATLVLVRRQDAAAQAGLALGKPPRDRWTTSATSKADCSSKL